MIDLRFNDAIHKLKAAEGKQVVVTYTATLNKDALNTDVETNTANITYSNNPNTNDTGKTTDKKVYVYDFDIVIDKYTGALEGGKRLSGASFVLMNADKTKYYKLDTVKDGEKEERKVTWVAEANAEEVTTDTNGAASFKGLKAGKYYLKETKAPDGYNLLKEPVEVEIVVEYNEAGQLIYKTVNQDGEPINQDTTTTVNLNNGRFEQTQPVENKSGATLPETGGFGTTMSYLIGSALVAGTAIMLIAKKRMNEAED